uniref:Uncharacterized protein n=1 Tax=viral metagenome TaxID=1070528 RepID=A0A6C0BZT0_9ZZZZ
MAEQERCPRASRNKHHKLWNDMKVLLPPSRRKNLQGRETEHRRGNK